MGKIVKNALELIGNTPLLKADRYAEAAGATKATILAKLCKTTHSIVHTRKEIKF